MRPRIFRGPGSGIPGGLGRGVERRIADLRRAERPGQPSGPASARSRGRPGGPGGSPRPPVPGNAGGHSGGAEGRRLLPASRSRLSRGAAGHHAGRRGRAAAALRAGAGLASRGRVGAGGVPAGRGRGPPGGIERRGPGAARRAGPPRLRHLHLGLHGPPQGGRDRAPGALQPGLLAQPDLRRHPRGPGHTLGGLRLRRLGLGGLAIPRGRREPPHPPGRAAAVAAGPGGLADPRTDHDLLPAHTAGRGGPGRGLAPGGSPAGGAHRRRPPPPGARAGAPVPLLQPLRPHGKQRGGHGLPRCAGRARRASAHRPSHRRRGDAAGECGPGGRGAGRRGGAVDRRRGARAGLPPPPGPDGRALRARSLRQLAGRADVPHGRPGAGAALPGISTSWGASTSR